MDTPLKDRKRIPPRTPPLVVPIRLGLASGLRKRPCDKTPAIPREAPDKAAVRTRGSLTSKRIVLAVISLSDSFSPYNSCKRISKPSKRLKELLLHSRLPKKTKMKKIKIRIFVLARFFLFFVMKSFVEFFCCL